MLTRVTLFWSLEIDDHHLVLAVAGVQHGEPAAAWVQSQVDRKVAKYELLAGRPQRPLVGQQHGPTRLDAGKDARRDGQPGRNRFTFRFELSG